MQRSIQHDTNSAAIYATAEDYVNRHSSVANFYADAYREILLQVWDVDDETREEIEEHLEQPPSRMELVDFEKRMDYIRCCIDVQFTENLKPENIWCFRNQWNLIEFVVEQEEKYQLITFQTSD